jgi:hypothetical protein
MESFLGKRQGVAILSLLYLQIRNKQEVADGCPFMREPWHDICDK